ncbi:MAG: MFS transporter [Anaerolineae bacterium]|nr:MFS transporter [Anaerolineae bacterium]
MSAASPTASSADKLDFKRVLPIFIIVLVDLLGLTVIIPLLPLYAASFGADPVTIGLMGSAYPMMQFLAAPILGGLSDRFGRKPVLVVSQIGTFIGFIILGFATTLPIVFLSRIVDGISGGNIVTAQAAITDSTTERTRTQGLGLIGAAFGLGFTLGPAIAGIALAVSGNDYRVPAFIAAGFSLLSILLTIFWFKETLPAEKRGQKPEGRKRSYLGNITRALANPAVSILLVVIFLQQLVFNGYENLFSLFSLSRLGLNAAGNALVFVYIGIVLVLVQGKYIGPLSRKYGERKLIFWGLGLVAVGLVITAITPAVTVPWYSAAEIQTELTNSTSAIQVPLPTNEASGWIGLLWILVASTPAAIGAGLLSPSINSLITKRVPSSEIGVSLGASSSLVSLANAVTPLIGGLLFQMLGTTAPFLIGGILLFGVLGLAASRIKPAPTAAVAPATK